MAALQQKQDELETIWVIGGTSVFQEALDSDLCHHVYLTKIHAKFDCDVFFPSLDERTDFVEVSTDNRDSRVPVPTQEEDGIKYTYTVYKKQV